MRRTLHTVYEYLALWIGVCVLGALTLPWSLIAVPIYYVFPRRICVPVGRVVITRCFRLYLWTLSVMGACRFDLEALDTLQNAGPLIIAPNHPCLLDASFVLSRLSNVVCIMKASIVDNLFLGAGARLAGYIRNDSPLNMVRWAVKELENGSQLLAFPEGTRTTHWPINALSSGIARIAARAQVPIQTVLIETTSPYLSKGWPLFRRPAMPIHYHVRLGQRFDPPVDPKSFTKELEQYFTDSLKNAPCFLSQDCVRERASSDKAPPST